MKKKILFETFFLLITVITMSCGPSNPKVRIDELLCNKSKNISGQTDSIISKDSIIKPSNFNFYFENSGSMKGYLKSTDFKDVVSNLIVKLNGKDTKDSLKLFTIASKPVPFEKEPETFIEELAKGRVPLHGFSTMHEIFEVILNESRPDDVNFFVSDCILSYSNKDISKNPEINKESVSELKNQLLNVVQEHVKENDISFALYAFKSNFNGVYYDYQNVKINGRFSARPYYIWVTGKKEYLKELASYMESLETFKNHLKEKIYFNLDEYTSNDYRIIKKPGKSGYRLSANKKDILEVENDSIIFYVALNLQCLPERLKTKSFLMDNLEIKAMKHKDKSNIEITDVYDYNSLMMKERIKNPKQLLICEQATHFLKIKVKDILSEETINITLPGDIPNWYKDWSTMNDKNINSSFDKTFAFEWFVNGIKEAYSSKDYINISININKKE